MKYPKCIRCGGYMGMKYAPVTIGKITKTVEVLECVRCRRQLLNRKARMAFDKEKS